MHTGDGSVRLSFEGYFRRCRAPAAPGRNPAVFWAILAAWSLRCLLEITARELPLCGTRRRVGIRGATFRGDQRRSNPLTCSFLPQASSLVAGVHIGSLRWQGRRSRKFFGTIESTSCECHMHGRSQSAQQLSQHSLRVHGRVQIRANKERTISSQCPLKHGRLPMTIFDRLKQVPVPPCPGLRLSGRDGLS
jgi:hypothetical protein